VLSDITLLVIMLNVFMLNVVMLNVFMLNVIMLNVVMLNVVMLNVFILRVVESPDLPENFGLVIGSNKLFSNELLLQKGFIMQASSILCI
jgi:hypothetical protein